MKKNIIFILIGIGLISVFFTLIQKTPSPPCFNADEAAFGYNAYSLLKTGRDEYGTLFPVRLKSFGDYKMPLYSYLSVPFIALFGLTEFGARALNVFLSFLLPIVVYLLTQEFFHKKKISILAAFLTSISLGLHIVARHAHEAYLAAFLTTLTSYFLIRSFSKTTKLGLTGLGISGLLLLFSYHPGRLFILFFLFYSLAHSLLSKKKNWIIPIILVSILGVFTISDILYTPTRLNNLLFFNSEGLRLKVQELKTEGGIRYLYHPLLIGLKEVVIDHLSYFSPQFLVQNGDNNTRFGYEGLSIMTPVEYLFLFIGIYYLFKNREKWRIFLFLLLLFSPLSASLSWSKGSLTRTLFILIPISLLSSYGLLNCIESCAPKFKKLIIVLIVLSGGAFLLISWDFYLFHYPKRLITIHAWQCGYKEINMFIKDNYDRTDTFYITRDIGMPYIFTLFYQQVEPSIYQKKALLTKPDEYGFGQIPSFDKYIFEFIPPDKLNPHTILIGSVDDFKNHPEINKNSLQNISVQGEPMFQIYSVQ